MIVLQRKWLKKMNLVPLLRSYLIAFPPKTVLLSVNWNTMRNIVVLLIRKPEPFVVPPFNCCFTMRRTKGLKTDDFSADATNEKKQSLSLSETSPFWSTTSCLQYVSRPITKIESLFSHQQRFRFQQKNKNWEAIKMFQQSLNTKRFQCCSTQSGEKPLTVFVFCLLAQLLMLQYISHEWTWVILNRNLTQAYCKNVLLEVKCYQPNTNLNYIWR